MTVSARDTAGSSQGVLCHTLSNHPAWTFSAVDVSPEPVERFACAGCDTLEGDGCFVFGGVNISNDLNDVVHLKVETIKEVNLETAVLFVITTDYHIPIVFPL